MTRSGLAVWVSTIGVFLAVGLAAGATVSGRLWFVAEQLKTYPEEAPGSETAQFIRKQMEVAR